jgi:predicted DNA-binding transcriptional regulator YafY
MEQEFLSELEGAIGAGRKVEIAYVSQKSTKPSRRKLGPLGLIMGRFHYLVAYEDGRAEEKPKTFRLDRIRKMTILDEPFSPPKGLTIDDFARRSFGVYDEEAAEVLWRFNRKSARDAALIQFHPSQKLSRPRKDGSLDVAFEAGSLREMVWELFIWGDGVSVLKPAALVDEWRRQLELSRIALSKSEQHIAATKSRRHVATASRTE